MKSFVAIGLHCMAISQLLPAQGSDMATCAAKIAASRPVPAIEYFSEALKTHQVVFIGEKHSVRQMYELYAEIVESPRIRGQLDDVFIEVLSSFHQGLLDRYLLDLETMSLEDLAPTWRDVPGVILSSGDDMASYGLIEKLRAVNEGLPRSERIRLLGGDSNLDWSAVANRRDWATVLNRRDRRFLEVIWDEVLDQDRRAIAILGRGHVKRVDPSPPNWINLVELVEKRSPGAIHVVHLMWPPLAQLDWPAPAVLSIADTCVADLRLEEESPHLRYGEQVDAVLFVGRSLDTVPSQPYPSHFQEVMKSRNERIR